MAAETHRDQKHFRELVNALSYPGRIQKFSSERSYRGDLLDETIELSLALLDGEVTLNIIDEHDESFEEIAIRTNTKKADLEKADFVIIPNTSIHKASETISKLKVGSLINPHRCATLILEVEAIGIGDDMIWSGPGIKDEIRVSISDSSLWIKDRNMAVSRFPMGIDLIIIDKNKNILGLPRTTSVKVVGE